MLDRPLAERVRPQKFLDLLGQDKIWAKGRPLYSLVEQDRFSALIFWGPPGSGKTSLAHVIGKHLERDVAMLSAVNAGVKDIRKVIEESTERQKQGHKATLMFMDEIHRLNKNQQDVLLPSLETGAIKFIGATTENPSFEVNSAIISRSLVFKFEPLSPRALVEILQLALSSPAADLERKDITVEVLGVIARSAGGDARRSLNLLEAVLLAAPKETTPISVDVLPSLSETLPLRYDKSGDNHYDTISAFIKSVRASHPDAAVYYLARMIDAGEDPIFIARRLVILASEDIGNANPTALTMATSALQAVHMIGMPEGRIVLSQITTYLASSPKSNRSYVAIDKALADVKEHGTLEIPLHLRNAPTQLMKEFGYGKNYAYAHDDLANARKLTYLPEQLRNHRYYIPSDIGVEKQLKENLEKLRPTKD